ncbi:porin family protein [Marinomonas sp. CT5]|uniref:porin family protein n=1 Tax=Marinomonas sp. CT5 TaxID=2066133 RepID=UPI00179D10CA|nr:porin family protein [Marinomonas sp. CT5]NVK72640.1 porin family protein [Oceanospirillaceae bacterium]QUX94139.1 porin family protein [Marinomonas sp. CT5]
MSTAFKKRTLFSGVLIASTLTTMAYAEQPKQGFTVTPSIGYYNTDDDRQAGNDTSYSVGVGYQTNSPLALEAVYLHSNANKRGRDNDLDQYRVDGLYSLPEYTKTNLTPYLAAGIGITDVDGDSNNLLVNAGGGVKYAINNDVNLRADFRLVKDIEDNYLDNVTSVGVQYSFGMPNPK